MPAQRFDLAHATLWRIWRPTFDHIRPRAAGGSDRPENLQLAHALCNRRKGCRPAPAPASGAAGPAG
ncbi:MAG: HNH endonuclease [Hyphomonas sp.]